MATFVVKLNDQVSPGAKSASKSTSELQSQLASLSDSAGSSGGLTESMGGLDAAMAAAPALAAAAAVAVAALGAAALYAGASLAVSAGEAKSAFLATASAMGGSADAGKQVLSMIDDLSMKLPITKDKLEALSKGFMSAGIRSVPALQKALEATAASTAMMGDEGGAAFASMIKKASLLGEAGKNFKGFSKSLQDVGLDVQDVAAQLGVPAKQLEAMLKSGKVTSAQLGDALQDAMIAKGAGSVAVANQSLGAMLDKVKTGLVALFDGVTETPGYKAFLGAIQQIGAVFGQNADAAKGAVTSTFGAIFGVAAKVLTWLAVSLLKIATFGLKAYVWMFPMLKAFKNWLVATHFLDHLVSVLKVIGIVIAALAAPFLLFAAVVVAQVIAIIQVLGYIISGFGKLWGLIVNFFKGAAAKLGEWADSAATYAARFVAGLTGGLAKGQMDVAKSSKELGDAAGAAIAASLKVKSPSRLTMEIGQFTALGLAKGMNDNADHVENAGKGLGEAAAASSTPGQLPPPASASRTSSSSMVVNVAAGAIVINGASGDVKELTREALSLLFEEIALSQGRGAAA